MRMFGILVIATLAGGCTIARMDGFDRLAATAPVERIDVTGIPGWTNGHFRLGAATGSVRRVALGDAVGWGPADAGPAVEAVKVGMAARFGTLAFDIARGDIGRIEARCRYARTERRDRVAGIDLATPSSPLRLDCGYRFDGVETGGLRLGAIAATSLADPRIGEVAVDGVTLGIRSTHRIEGLRGESEQPIGYYLDAAGTEPVAAIETNGLSSRRLLLPRDPAQRRAALAALLTLALFWDPGNVD